MSIGTSPFPTDTRLTIWKRILQYYQNQPGAKSHNNPNTGDTVRMTLFKIARAINGI